LLLFFIQSAIKTTERKQETTNDTETADTAKEASVNIADKKTETVENGVDGDDKDKNSS
jgi:hypothetical protein